MPVHFHNHVISPAGGTTYLKATPRIYTCYSFSYYFKKQNILPGYGLGKAKIIKLGATEQMGQMYIEKNKTIYQEKT